MGVGLGWVGGSCSVIDGVVDRDVVSHQSDRTHRIAGRFVTRLAN